MPRRRSSERTPSLDRPCRPTRAVRQARKIPDPRAAAAAAALSMSPRPSEIEKTQLAAVALERTSRFPLEHHGDETITRIEDQRVQRPLRARAVRRGELLERELEERVQLDG